MSEVGDDPLEEAAGAVGPGEQGTIDDLPGMARLTASAAWHTTGWALRSYAKAGARLMQVAARPDTAPEVASEIRAAIREYARELLGEGDGSRRTPTGPGTGSLEREQEWAALRVAGAEVLRKSRDVNYVEAAHPAYERILGDLAPDEARILRLFMVDGPQPSIDVRTGGPIALLNSRLIAQGFTMIGARAGCRYPARVPQYLNNLNRLGMTWFSRETLHNPVRYQVLEAQPDVLAATKSVRMARVVRRSIHLTPFGEDFCNICLAIDTDPLDELPEHAEPSDEATGGTPPP